MNLSNFNCKAVALLLATAACSGVGGLAHQAWAGRQALTGYPHLSGPPVAKIEHKSNVLSVAWAPDGKRLATATSDGTITVIDAATAKEMRSFAAGGSVLCIAFSPDGKKIGLCRLVKALSQLAVLDVESGKVLQAAKDGGRSIGNAGVEQLTFSPGGRSLIAVRLGHFG